MDNRTRFRHVLETYSITQGQAAEMIAFRTKRPCSIRTVRAWLADREAKTALGCPDWALEALEFVIQKIERYNAQREAEEQAKETTDLEL